jgi:3-hydroxyacyl-CoA dehydrogenase
LRPALDLIVGGLPIDAVRAHELGLVDAIIHGDLRVGALAFAERLLAERTPLRKVSALSVRLEEPNPFEDYAARVRERSRGFLAPLQCVSAIRAALELPFPQGLERERELFRELMQSPQSKAQRHVFFSEREVAKIPGLPDATATRDVKSVAVIGAGSMGTGIAICFADARIPVTLIDIAEDALARGIARVEAHYRGAVAAGRLPPAELDERVGLVRPALAYDGARQAELVVEAVPEDLARKREVFATLDAICKPGAILATTTSYLDVDQIAAATKRPGDVLALHFGRPPHEVKLLENARARRTTPDVWATASKLGKALGKVSVPVLAHPGFVGNRMLAQQLREAFFLLEEGALPAQVDRAFRDFGFPVGPFAAADRVGLETLWEQRKLNHERLTSREQACDILDKVVGRGRLGRSSGSGFYRYGPDGAPEPDPALEDLLVEHSTARGFTRRPIGDDEIVERCLYAMINEGASILEEGIAPRPLDIDMVWIHGYDFPSYRGGPMFYADELGLERVHRAILDLQTRLGPECWTPTPLLERLAKEGSGFYRAR